MYLLQFIFNSFINQITSFVFVYIYKTVGVSCDSFFQVLRWQNLRKKWTKNQNGILIKPWKSKAFDESSLSKSTSVSLLWLKFYALALDMIFVIYFSVKKVGFYFAEAAMFVDWWQLTSGKICENSIKHGNLNYAFRSWQGWKIYFLLLTSR